MTSSQRPEPPDGRGGGRPAADEDEAPTADVADVLEQRAGAGEADEGEASDEPDPTQAAYSRGEASEADAAEQHREVHLDEDDYR